MVWAPSEVQGVEHWREWLSKDRHTKNLPRSAISKMWDKSTKHKSADRVQTIPRQFDGVLATVFHAPPRPDRFTTSSSEHSKPWKNWKGSIFSKSKPAGRDLDEYRDAFDTALTIGHIRPTENTENEHIYSTSKELSPNVYGWGSRRKLRPGATAEPWSSLTTISAGVKKPRPPTGVRAEHCNHKGEVILTLGSRFRNTDRPMIRWAHLSTSGGFNASTVDPL